MANNDSEFGKNLFRKYRQAKGASLYEDKDKENNNENLDGELQMRRLDAVISYGYEQVKFYEKQRLTDKSEKMKKIIEDAKEYQKSWELMKKSNQKDIKNNDQIINFNKFKKDFLANVDRFCESKMNIIKGKNDEIASLFKEYDQINEQFEKYKEEHPIPKIEKKKKPELKEYKNDEDVFNKFLKGEKTGDKDIDEPNENKIKEFFNNNKSMIIYLSLVILIFSIILIGIYKLKLQSK